MDWSSLSAVFSLSLMERKIWAACAGPTLIAPVEPSVSGTFVTTGSRARILPSIRRRNAEETTSVRLRVQIWNVWRRTKGKDYAKNHFEIVTTTTHIVTLKKVRSNLFIYTFFYCCWMAYNSLEAKTNILGEKCCNGEVCCSSEIYQELTSSNFDCCSSKVQELLSNEDKILMKIMNNDNKETTTTTTTENSGDEKSSTKKNAGSSLRMEYWILLLCLILFKWVHDFPFSVLILYIVIL